MRGEFAVAAFQAMKTVEGPENTPASPAEIPCHPRQSPTSKCDEGQDAEASFQDSFAGQQKQHDSEKSICERRIFSPTKHSTEIARRQAASEVCPQRSATRRHLCRVRLGRLSLVPQGD